MLKITLSKLTRTKTTLLDLRKEAGHVRPKVYNENTIVLKSKKNFSSKQGRIRESSFPTYFLRPTNIYASTFGHVNQDKAKMTKLPFTKYLMSSIVHGRSLPPAPSQ